MLYSVFVENNFERLIERLSKNKTLANTKIFFMFKYFFRFKTIFPSQEYHIPPASVSNMLFK